MFSESSDAEEFYQEHSYYLDSTRRPREPDPNLWLENEIAEMGESTFMYSYGIHRYQLQKLFSILEAKIKKTHTKFPQMKFIRPRDRIIICLRFLATGNSLRDLSVQFDLPASIVATIVQEVCHSIWQELGSVVMPPPSKALWKLISKDFKNIHKMPNCIGSITGGNLNVMDQTTLDLVVLVDANCRIVMIDIGRYGINCDVNRGLYRSKMVRRFESNDFNVPAARPLRKGAQPVPYILIGGPYFPTKRYLLNKYKVSSCMRNNVHKVFNSRISPARQTARHAYSRLRSRWRIIQKAIPMPPAMIENIILAVCCLHNYFCLPSYNSDNEDPFSKELSQDAIASLQASVPASSRDIRYEFERYFLSTEGRVPWQWEPLMKSDA